jgi:hypothetical protein
MQTQQRARHAASSTAAKIYTGRHTKKKCEAEDFLGRYLRATTWAGLLIFYLLPCAHPTCPNRLELPPGRMGWSWNRQNHPERPLWPREITSPRRQHRAPVGALPPSPEQRDKVAPLGKGVKPPCRAGYCRELDAPRGLSAGAAKPPRSDT